MCNKKSCPEWRRQLLAVFVTWLTLVSVGTATAQTRPSDSEMKEVVRLLLEREVPRTADARDVTVLLGPNVKSSWIPEVSGLSIRKRDDTANQLAE